MRYLFLLGAVGFSTLSQSTASYDSIALATACQIGYVHALFEHGIELESPEQSAQNSCSQVAR